MGMSEEKNGALFPQNLNLYLSSDSIAYSYW